ncbi:alkaline phosphatase family protein [Halosimplex salinum]|uniref:alkaline phosphatase family protein n=1 Tax=Halosimplex salinum TaxID=1710538 RepID=UPI000F492389|nr:alkaline phosphatase family protein [Halosimplex salinum]
MLRTGDAAALLDRRTRDGLVVPDYERYCFANVPGTAADAFGVDVGRSLPADVLAGVESDVSNVVVVLLDGLGWRRWRRDAEEHRLLARLSERGSVRPLTSVAPSSTASAITTMHTAAPPAEHGVFGWDVRLSEHETVVEAFPHEVRDPGEGSATPPVAPDEVVRADPIYPALESAGVETAVVQPTETLGSEYASATFRGATQIPYDDVTSGATALRERLESVDGPSYTYCYVSELDTTSHDFGTDSGAYHDALATVTTALSRALYDAVDPETAAETLVCLTADHGLVDFDSGPEGCLDLLSVDGLADALARDQSGDPFLPWGDYRFLHLAIREGEESRARRALEARGATVLTRDEVRDRGFFGPVGEPTLDGRCGDLVCTHPDLKLVYPGAEKIVPKIGMHGGPTPREMLVPFAAARLSDLQ